MATMMGILHLGPGPPSHAAPSTTLTTSGLLCNSRSSTFLRPLPKMQMGSARLRLGSRCAAGGSFELSPEEDVDTRVKSSTPKFPHLVDSIDGILPSLFFSVLYEVIIQNESAVILFTFTIYASYRSFFLSVHRTCFKPFVSSFFPFLFLY